VTLSASREAVELWGWVTDAGTGLL